MTSSLWGRSRATVGCSLSFHPPFPTECPPAYQSEPPEDTRRAPASQTGRTSAGGGGGSILHSLSRPPPSPRAVEGAAPTRALFPCSSALRRHCSVVFWPPLFLMETRHHSCPSPVCARSFLFSVHLQGFLFIFELWQLSMLARYDFLCICLEFAECHKSVHFFHQICAYFLPLFSPQILRPFLYVLVYLVLLHSSLGLGSFSCSLFPPCPANWITSVDLPSSSRTPLHLQFGCLSSDLFILVLVAPGCVVSIWFFILAIYWLRLSICPPPGLNTCLPCGLAHIRHRS